MSIVEFKNVFYIYPNNNKYALENITFSVKKGEFFAVMGENGAGKTTLCKLINGLIPHHCGGRLSGTVTVDGLNTVESTIPQLALKAGIVLDDPDAQLFTSSVRHEAAFGSENLLLPPDEIEERITFALCAVGLKGYKERVPSTLSGGEKQRLSIAAALAMKGKILVLDDPLCRLDPDGAQEVITVLDDIRLKYQMTIIIVCGDSRKMAHYADRVCLLNNGRVSAIDTADKIFSDSDLLEENGIMPVKITERIKINHTTQCEHQGDAGLLFRTDSLLKKPMIQVSNFSYRYERSNININNINLTIYENDFIAVMGKNGCGKTTLLKNITGLLKPSGGDIYIRGRNTKELTVADISKEVGFVMQNPDTQLFTDSVYNETAFALKNLRLSKKEISQRVKDALNIVGLHDETAFPHALSRPDRIMTIIASVLAMGCRIIILDEVDAGNDYRGSLKIMNIARELHSKGFTIVFVTHNIYLADNFAHRLVKMERDYIYE
ncbi:MAG: energy-coupling factor transporter ATPase [Treponema sp.]|nr:energy-coupling factor transporter ATPase [Treponema sp.]